MKALLLVLLLPLAAYASGPREAELSWTAPTLNTDGTPITQPLKYRVYGGLEGQPVTLLLETTQRLVLLTRQPIGRMCYYATAVTENESAPSATGCKTMTLAAPTEGSIERPTEGSIERN